MNTASFTASLRRHLGALPHARRSARYPDGRKLAPSPASLPLIGHLPPVGN